MHVYYFWNTLAHLFISVALTHSHFCIAREKSRREREMERKLRKRVRERVSKCGCNANHSIEWRSEIHRTATEYLSDACKMHNCTYFNFRVCQYFFAANRTAHLAAMIRNWWFKVDLFCLGMSLLCAW